MYEQYKGKIIASLVLGIVSVVLVWFGYTSIVALACAIVGLVLSVQIRKAYEAAGEKCDNMTTAGFILSIIGLAISAIYFIIFISCAGALGLSLIHIFLEPPLQPQTAVFSDARNITCAEPLVPVSFVELSVYHLALSLIHIL